MKNLIPYVLIPVLCFLVFVGGFQYKTEYARTAVETYTAENQSDRLTVYTVGEPGFPFGPGKCSLVLSRDGKVADELEFTLYNDGKLPSAENFTVNWDADGVQVTVSGEEQEDITYTLYFDAKNR